MTKPENFGSDVSTLHYKVSRALEEHPQLAQAKGHYDNVGWSLGNYCPLHCKQCYSFSAREPGQNLTHEIVDRVVDQLASIGTKTINLGGNEPIFTNGRKISESMLPYIIKRVTDAKMGIGITSAGITIVALHKRYPEMLALVNDVDISLDSPFEAEHNANRGDSSVWKNAMQALEILQNYNIPHSLIMCSMNWNFDEKHIKALIELARKTNSNVRFNPMKPIEPQHMDLVLTPEQFYAGLNIVLEQCDPVDLSDPAWASSAGMPSETVSGCPCGTGSFRIHSITPDGKLPVSPCVYLHDYKVGDLATQPIEEILESVPFQAFRRRKENPEMVEGCKDCGSIDTCGGGCASRAYLHTMHEQGDEARTLFAQDPYCPAKYAPADMRPATELLNTGELLVHQGYLCTGIFQPR